MMDRETAARLVRAARVLLRMDAETFAGKVGVSVATLKRFEAGHAVGDEVADRIVGRLGDAGVVVIRATGLFPDVSIGLALLTSAELGAGPRSRSDIGPKSRKSPTGPDQDVGDDAER